jgi:hypothetical protein
MAKIAKFLTVVGFLVVGYPLFAGEAIEGIDGMIVESVNGFLIKADRDYVISGLTVLLDDQGVRFSRGQLSHGREATIVSATTGESGNAPVAIRVIVYEPH